MPSLARGVALASLLASSWVLGLAVTARWPRPTPVAMPVCRSPVEVCRAGSRPRLACADDVELRTCTAAVAGDRVWLQPTGCQVEAGAMQAGWRLLHGLKLDINRASAADLQLVDGVGPKTAMALVACRERTGPWRNLDAMRQVRGMGPKTVARLAQWLMVDADRQ